MGDRVQRMSAVAVLGLVLVAACAASFPVEVSGANDDDQADALRTTAALSSDTNRGKTTATPSYRAAVVEHAPISVPGLVTRTEALKVMMENLDVYEAHLHNASAAQQLDIIVYPEDGLFGDDKCQRDEIYPYLERIPENRLPSQPLFNPCEQAATELFQDTPVLVRLSCLARTYSTAVVADMGDVQPCSLSNDPFCPRDGRYQFNTQVAFDNDGTLLAKYHKTHLFYEPQYDTPRHPSPVTFTTSFGVRFGMVVCFDLMFPLPPVDLVRELQVQDIVYSTWWINTPPSFSATQYQQAWSRSLGVNLLAAGNGNAWLYSGSGIFSRGETLAELYNIYYTGHDSVGVADVPILSGALQEKNVVSRALALQPPAALTNGIAPVSSRATERAWMERQAQRGGVEQFEVHCPADGATNGDLGYAPAWREVYEEAQSAGNVRVSPHDGSMTATSRTHGVLTLSAPFQMHAGRQMKASATALHLTCTAQLNASAIQPYIKNDSDSEWYVVFAFAGQYDNETMFYREHFCATFRCFNETTCLYDLIFANTIFSGFELTATMPQGHTMFTLTATNNAALIPNSYIKSGWKMGAPSRPEYYVTSHRDGGDRDFGYILLNASLLARDLRNL